LRVAVLKGSHPQDLPSAGEPAKSQGAPHDDDDESLHGFCASESHSTTTVHEETDPRTQEAVFPSQSTWESSQALPVTLEKDSELQTSHPSWTGRENDHHIQQVSKVSHGSEDEQEKLMLDPQFCSLDAFTFLASAYGTSSGEEDFFIQQAAVAQITAENNNMLVEKITDVLPPCSASEDHEKVTDVTTHYADIPAQLEAGLLLGESELDPDSFQDVGECT
jgi:hypothetical protein